MHVGGLHIFRLPDDAPADYVQSLHQRLLECTELAPMYRRKPSWPGALGAVRWTDDEDVDLDYHVRLSALPRPGRVRELLALVSRLHATLLDRHRPLWEFHLIEGLDDNRFAVYVKVHHALTDGVNAVRNTLRMLSPASTGELRALWSPGPRPTLALDTPAGATAPLARAGALARNLAGVLPTVAGVAVRGIRNLDAALPFSAPRTPLNRPLTGARRFAAQSWSIERIKLVAKRYDATLNDVVLAMCSGALREYLRNEDELPSRSLVAAVPVALPRSDGDGNAVTMVLCRLASEVADPAERLARIQASMLAAKDMMRGRTPLQLSTIGMLTSIGPSGLNAIPGFAAAAPPPYNVVISNVPGPRERLFWQDAELEGWYPVSMPIEGQSLNITVLSYGDNLEFGLIGCRRNVAHLQRLLGHLEASLAALEAA